MPQKVCERYTPLQDVYVLAVLDLWVPRSRFIVVASNLVFGSFKMPHLILPPVPPL